MASARGVPPGFSGLKKVYAPTHQARAKDSRLGALPAAFATLDRDEFAPPGHDAGFDRAGVAAAVGWGGFLRNFITA